VREDQSEGFEWDVTEDATTGALTREERIDEWRREDGTGHDSSVLIHQVT